MNSRRCSSYALNSFRHCKQKLQIFQSQLSFIDGKARDVKNAIAKEISKAIIVYNHVLNHCGSENILFFSLTDIETLNVEDKAIHSVLNVTTYFK